MLAGSMLIAIGLAACGSAAGQTAGAGPKSTPRLITAKSVGGSPGKGPVIVSNPAPLPGGKTGSQKVVLRDRILVINNVTKHRGADQRSILIDLDLVIRNTTGAAIRNESAFFQLVGPGGDAFGYQDNSPDGFYRSIGAHASRNGTIEFQIPAAAGSSLYLLYRPEIATETVLTPLKPG